MKNNVFSVIDFETATSSRNSACQVAVSFVKDEIFLETIDSLIKPPNNKFSSFNIGIHKITPDMTKDAPTMDEWHNDIFLPKAELYGIPIMVAHNVGFDKSVYNASVMNNKKDFYWFCTHQAFRKLGYEKTKLNILCEKFGIELKHHDAKSDTIATGHLYLKYLKLIEI